MVVAVVAEKMVRQWLSRLTGLLAIGKKRAMVEVNRGGVVGSGEGGWCPWHGCASVGVAWQLRWCC